MRLTLLAALLLLIAPAGARAADRVVTLPGYRAPGTPARLDKVTVVEAGPAAARRVLVLEPGTQAGAGSLLPVAHDLVHALPGWQVWAIDRRENLLEDHSALDSGDTPQQLFDYYLGWIGNANAGAHLQPVASADYARGWGMRVAVEDLRRVIAAARRGGRTVALGGHSLGATIAVAYATWDFAGRAGARDLAGLVLIDGGGGAKPPTAAGARQQLATLATGSPFLDLVGLKLPWAAGVLNAVGSTLAVRAPHAPAQLAAWPLLPASLRPPVAVDNQAAYGYAVDAATGPPSLALVQAHVGHLAASGDPRGWVDAGPSTVEREAAGFAERAGIDGSAWYHPLRLSIDGGAVDDGIPNPAQKALGLRTTRRAKLPIYAISTSLGDGRVLSSARTLARRAHAPAPTLVDRSKVYSHCDPLFALPARNAFVKTVAPFLRRATSGAARTRPGG